MRRRALLSVCGASLASLSGCAIQGEDAETPPDTSTEPPVATTSETPTETPADSPTPSPSESSDRPCLQSDEVTIRAADEFVATEKYDSFVFELRNGTACPVALEPSDAWEISEKTADGWEPFASEDGVGPDERALHADDGHWWSLSLNEHPTPWSETGTFIFVDLPEGTYKFSVTATVDGVEEITRETTFDVVRRIPTASDSGNASN